MYPIHSAMTEWHKSSVTSSGIGVALKPENTTKMSRLDSVTQKITNKKCTCHRPSVLKGLKIQQGTRRLICWHWVDCQEKPAKNKPNKIILDTLNALRVADLMRGPDISHVLKIRSEQLYKQCA
jgi:hypothetical protein